MKKKLKDKAFARAVPRVAAQVGGVAEGAVVFYAEVGRELAGDLVAQAGAELDGRQSGADTCQRIRLAIGIRLRPPLQNQAIGQQRVVFGLGSQRRASALANIGGGRYLELVRREALHAERCPGSRWPFAHILAYARQNIPPWPHAAAV